MRQRQAKEGKSTLIPAAKIAQARYLMAGNISLETKAGYQQAKKWTPVPAVESVLKLCWSREPADIQINWRRNKGESAASFCLSVPHCTSTREAQTSASIWGLVRGFGLRRHSSNQFLLGLHRADPWDSGGSCEDGAEYEPSYKRLRQKATFLGLFCLAFTGC